jgi:adenylylsulfate kinase-like enzyme/ubiquinone/menaquinone biosynthesis C-methylase UbiE
MKYQPEQSDNGLIWITGYSGAGKTTIARIASEKLKEIGIPVVLLDGDDLRSILGERFGHALDDRRQLAYVYSRLCQKISECGVTVVIATIAMFESVRVENRASNEKYLEVYLDVPLAVREERDPKGLYRAASARLSNTVGFPSGLEEPVNPDLVIENYGQMLPEVAASLIVAKYSELGLIKYRSQEVDFEPNLGGGISLDRIQYWDSYYNKRKAPINPSSFALFCNENYLDRYCHILEFGCGNGRDSFYFAKTHRITAIDESKVVVEASRMRAMQEGILSLNFLHGEFGREIPGLPNEIDAVYGRFVIHAMPEDAETRALRESWRLLKNGGKLFLEFRTNRDPLMAKGVQLGENERITDHYRRFVDFKEFCVKLTYIGFSLEFAVEKQGLASHGNDDPIVGRIVATKQIVGLNS